MKFINVQPRHYTVEYPALKWLDLEADLGIRYVPFKNRVKERHDLSRERAFVFAWYCFACAPDKIIGRRTYRFSDYCSAPAGIRCRCGKQLADHDPGDEDPRAP